MARQAPPRRGIRGLADRLQGRAREGSGAEADADLTSETPVVDVVPAASTEALPAVGFQAVEGPPPETGPPPVRIAMIAASSTIAASLMTGGVFLGVAPHVTAIFAGLAGIALAMRAARVKRPGTMYVLVFLGVVAIALIVTLPSGLSHLASITKDMRVAAREGNVLRPPVEFLAGWRPILGLLMGLVGFAAAWAGIEMRRPALALAVPIPVLAISAISVPESLQLGIGLVALVLFGIGLGILSGTEAEGGQKVSLAYEMRRAMRATPLIGAITVVMYLLAQTNFLFPDPLYDPAQEAQKPKAVPLTETKDRVLFRVDSKLTGPWRMGTLDVYDGQDWRLPPYAKTRFVDVEKSGVVDEDLAPGVDAKIEVAGLSGPVLPGLGNLVGVVAEGPKLVYDLRTQNIRLKQGQVQSGLRYTLIASKLPTVGQLRTAPSEAPDEVRQFAEIADPPPAMQVFIDQALTKKNKWDQLSYLRQLLLRTVVASGSGTPVSVTPERVVSMLTSNPESTPFEIVAAEAMIARWLGIPSRIGYGFDGGDKVDGKLEVHPKHGATWLEVYFPGYKWLPVIGKPLQAKTSQSNQEQQQTDLQASQDISVQLFFPTVIPPPSQLLERVRNALAIIVPAILALVLLYLIWPAIRKLYARNRRRTWALDAGPLARIAVAYAEWRDLTTDYGFAHHADTPLMFLDRVVPDEEHTELAWLVTRTLWGDMRSDVFDADAEAAEEISRSLRRRLAQTQTWVMRVIAATSRLSIRHPYGADLSPVAVGGAPPAPLDEAGAEVEPSPEEVGVHA